MLIFKPFCFKLMPIPCWSLLALVEALACGSYKIIYSRQMTVGSGTRYNRESPGMDSAPDVRGHFRGRNVTGVLRQSDFWTTETALTVSVIRPMGCSRQRWNADYAFSQICRDGPHWLLFP